MKRWILLYNITECENTQYTSCNGTRGNHVMQDGPTQENCSLKRWHQTPWKNPTNKSKLISLSIQMNFIYEAMVILVARSHSDLPLHQHSSRRCCSTRGCFIEARPFTKCFAKRYGSIALWCLCFNLNDVCLTTQFVGRSFGFLLCIPMLIYVNCVATHKDSMRHALASPCKKMARGMQVCYAKR